MNATVYFKIPEFPIPNAISARARARARACVCYCVAFVSLFILAFELNFYIECTQVLGIKSGKYVRSLNIIYCACWIV